MALPVPPELPPPIPPPADLAAQPPSRLEIEAAINRLIGDGRLAEAEQRLDELDGPSADPATRDYVEAKRRSIARKRERLS